MKIKIQQEFAKEGDFKIVDLETIVSRKVDGSDHESGQLEDMARTIDNQTWLLAKIIERLNLSDNELTEMLGEWGEKLCTRWT